MNGTHIIAKRYASAYLNAYDKDITLALLERVQGVIAFFKEYQSAQLVLKLSTVHGDQQRSNIKALLEAYKLPASLLTLVDTLSDQSRLALFPLVLEQLMVDYKKRHNIAEFTVTSPEPLSQEQLATIVQFLEAQTGKKIIVTEKIDQSLIAGIRLQSDTLMWQYSIEQQLNQLKHQFNA